MGKTYLIITCCINNVVGIQDSSRRKNEYFLAISNVLASIPKDIIPIIVENSCNGESYLDVFNCNIFYTKDNHFETDDKYLLHKGYNELRDIKKVIEHYNIQDDDMIVKLTGRYLLFKDDIFEFVNRCPEKDAFLRYFNVMTYTSDDIDMVQGLFALRCKYFKMFEYRNPELGCEEDFVSNINEFIPQDKIMRLNKLWLRIYLGDTGKMLDV
jgi:hypothetical protein